MQFWECRFESPCNLVNLVTGVTRVTGSYQVWVGRGKYPIHIQCSVDALWKHNLKSIYFADKTARCSCSFWLVYNRLGSWA